MTAVLDAWAATAVLNDEEAAERVERVIGRGEAVMSWINVGETYYAALRRRGRPLADRAVRALRAAIRTEEPDADLVLAAARLKAAGRISYADCFAVATAQRHVAPLYTGDPELLALGDTVEVVDLRAGA